MSKTIKASQSSGEVNMHIRRARQTDCYATEEIALDLTEQLLRHMDQKELAQQAGMPLSLVSKILSGAENFTLKTILRLVRAAGLRLKISLVDIDEHSAAGGGDA